MKIESQTQKFKIFRNAFFKRKKKRKELDSKPQPKEASHFSLNTNKTDIEREGNNKNRTNHAELFTSFPSLTSTGSPIRSKQEPY